MSKGNMLLGHARGKVGDLVFSRVNGQQVTRARASVVKNPQTEKQVIQRILLNTVIQAYSRMAEICDHSYEGVQVGQKSMSRFMRENLTALRNKVADYVAGSGSFEGVYAFAPKGLNQFTPNEWVIATGQLPQVTLASVDANDGAAIAIVSAGAIPTYGEIIASLGLQRGDQLTFIGQELYTDGRAAFKFARVILDPREDDGSQADLDTPFLADGIVNKPSPRNEGADIVFTSAANILTFDLGANSMFGAAVIVSRQKADGSWLRSNTIIALDPDVPYALVGAMDMQEAIDYSYAGGIDLGSERYLNNAVRGTKILAPTPSPEPTPPVVLDPILTSLSSGGRSILSSNESAMPSTDSASIAFEGTDLNGSTLVLIGGTEKQIGDAVDVAALDAGKKAALTANSGSASFTVPINYEHFYLISNGKVKQVCGSISKDTGD